jgi:Fe2+ or Zn2+ uptake regulation protein
MRLTDNQLKILKVLQDKNDDGSYVDLDQLLDKLSVEYDWLTSKAALQWSLRKLIDLDLVERLGTDVRRHRSRRMLRLTELGTKVMGPGR